MPWLLLQPAETSQVRVAVSLCIVCLCCPCIPTSVLICRDPYTAIFMQPVLAKDSPAKHNVTQAACDALLCTHRPINSLPMHIPADGLLKGMAFINQVGPQN